MQYFPNDKKKKGTACSIFAEPASVSCRLPFSAGSIFSLLFECISKFIFGSLMEFRRIDDLWFFNRPLRSFSGSPFFAWFVRVMCLRSITTTSIIIVISIIFFLLLLSCLLCSCISPLSLLFIWYHRCSSLVLSFSSCFPLFFSHLFSFYPFLFIASLLFSSFLIFSFSILSFPFSFPPLSSLPSLYNTPSPSHPP